MAKLCLALFLFQTFRGYAADPEWDSAVLLLQQGKNRQAISSFESWMTRAEKEGIRSPQVHHNLAIAYAQMEGWGPAVFHLATSALLRENPLYAWEASRSLSLLQHRLMIQDAVSDHWGFRLVLLLPKTFLFGTFMVGLWVFVFSFLFRTVKRVGTASGVLLLGVALCGFMVRASLPAFGVVLGGPQGTGLYSDPLLEPEKKQVDLSEGTLVAIGPARESAIAITAPFAGWLPLTSVRFFARPQSAPLTLLSEARHPVPRF